MFTIPRDSEAFRVLESMINDPDTRYIRFAVRNVHGVDEPMLSTHAIALSQNQQMWTPPLEVEEVQ